MEQLTKQIAAREKLIQVIEAQLSEHPIIQDLREVPVEAIERIR